MKNIYNSENITLEVGLSKDIFSDNYFGNINFTINGQRISNNQEGNLGYFFVDCECLKAKLQTNDTIENDLFHLKNDVILQYWEEWKVFLEKPDDQEKETVSAVFFDTNYFKTGNVFSSYFFDEIMLFFNVENDRISFKYWNKLEGQTKINQIDCDKIDLLNCLNAYILFFENLDASLKSDNV